MAQIGAGGAIRLIQSLWDAGTVVALDDAELLERFLAHDATAEVAFADLVRRHAPMMLRVCRAVTGNPHDAEDAAQVNFLVLARQARSIRREESLANWQFGSRMSVQSRPGHVDNPRSDADGRLRDIVEPGKWVYFVAHVPDSAGYGQPRLERRVDLQPRGTVTVRFELRK